MMSLNSLSVKVPTGTFEVPALSFGHFSIISKVGTINAQASFEILSKAANFLTVGSLLG